MDVYFCTTVLIWGMNYTKTTGQSFRGCSQGRADIFSVLLSSKMKPKQTPEINCDFQTKTMIMGKYFAKYQNAFNLNQTVIILQSKGK